MKLAMSVGTNNHYRVEEIQGRHFLQTADAAGVPKALVQDAMGEIAAALAPALDRVAAELPLDFPAAIPEAVREAALRRLRGIT